MVTMVTMLLTPVFYAIVYRLPTITNTKIDAGSRAYIIAVYMDIFDCFIKPMAVIFGAPTIRQKVSKQLRRIKRILFNKNELEEFNTINTTSTSRASRKSTQQNGQEDIELQILPM